MDFRILGPLAVHADGRRLALGGPKQRALLAILLLSADRVVSRDRLIEELWADDPPAAARHALEVNVSRLRKALGANGAGGSALVTRAPGYVLHVAAGELDLWRFEDLVEDGRRAFEAGDPDAAARAFREAEGLWRGRPLADLEFEPFARVDVERLEELRLAAVEQRVEAELAVGPPRSVGRGARGADGRAPAARAAARPADAGAVSLRAPGGRAGGLPRVARGARRADRCRARAGAARAARGDPAPGPRAGRAAAARAAAGARGQRSPLAGRDGRAGAPARRAGSGRAPVAGVLVTVERAGGDRPHAARRRAGRRGAPRRARSCSYGAGRASRGRRDATRPTLLVLDDIDDDAVTALTEAAPRARVAAGARASRSPLMPNCAERLSVAEHLALGPLDADAIGAIAALYAPGDAELPVARAGRAQRRRAAARAPAGGRLGARARRRAGCARSRTARPRSAATCAGRVASSRAASPSCRPCASAPSCAQADGGAEASARTRAWRPSTCARRRVLLRARAPGRRDGGAARRRAAARASSARRAAASPPPCAPGCWPSSRAASLPGSEGWAQVAAPPRRAPAARRSSARSPAADAGSAVLIAVDQFEETFTLCRDEDERAAFVDALVALATARGRRGRRARRARRLLRPLRRLPGAGALLGANQVLVGPMQRDELRRAIELPARARRAAASSRSSSTRCSPTSTDEPGALPLLSTALLELWQQRDGRRLRLAAYERTGGVRGRGRAAGRGGLRPPRRRAAGASRAASCCGSPARTRAASRPAARRRSTSSTPTATTCAGARRAGRRPPRDAQRGHRRGRARGAAARVAAAARLARGGRRGPAAAPPPGATRRASGTAAGAIPASSTAARGWPRRSTGAPSTAPSSTRSSARSSRRAARERARGARARRTNRRLRALLAGVAALLRPRRGGRRAVPRPARHARATRRAPRRRSGSAPRRSSRTTSTARCCSRARASRSTTPCRRAATCSPRSCAARPRSASCASADTGSAGWRCGPTAACWSSATSTATSCSSTRPRAGRCGLRTATHTAPHPGSSRSARRLAAGRRRLRRTIHLLDGHTFRRIAALDLPGHDVQFINVAFSPDGHELVAMYEQAAVGPPPQPVRATLLRFDGRTGGGSGRRRSRNRARSPTCRLRTRRPLAAHRRGRADAVPGPERAGSCSTGAGSSLRDPRTLRPLRRFPASPSRARCRPTGARSPPADGRLRPTARPADRQRRTASGRHAGAVRARVHARRALAGHRRRRREGHRLGRPPPTAVETFAGPRRPRARPAIDRRAHALHREPGRHRDRVGSRGDRRLGRTFRPEREAGD